MAAILPSVRLLLKFARNLKASRSSGKAYDPSDLKKPITVLGNLTNFGSIRRSCAARTVSQRNHER